MVQEDAAIFTASIVEWKITWVSWVFPAFNQAAQLNIDRKLTEVMIYSGGAVSSESALLCFSFFSEWLNKIWIKVLIGQETAMTGAGSKKAMGIYTEFRQHM